MCRGNSRKVRLDKALELAYENAKRSQFYGADSMLFPIRFALPLMLLVAATPAVQAADDVVVRLTIKDHRFTPDRLEIPAKTRVVLVVRNEDKEAEEFECEPLRREKIVFPGTEARVVLGRVDPGEYPFYGEYHADTAKGVLVAK